MSDEDEDLRAAEYVLGLGERAERRRFEDEAARDPRIASARNAWERRLAPLLQGFRPVAPPPALRARLEQSAFGASPSWGVRLRAGAAGFALAAALAVAAVLSAPPREAVPVAALLPTGAGRPVLVVMRGGDGALAIRAVGPVTVPAGHDYELWSLPRGAARPVAIGLLRHGSARPGRVEAGKILVSLEPAGGSPSGLPTGAVLWGGEI